MTQAFQISLPDFQALDVFDRNVRACPIYFRIILEASTGPLVGLAL
jgi:hypothetical protein